MSCAAPERLAEAERAMRVRTARVAVDGYGVIGERETDAVAL